LVLNSSTAGPRLSNDAGGVFLTAAVTHGDQNVHHQQIEEDLPVAMVEFRGRGKRGR
jgi:hypothetical protein